jgi:hypothetical protein
MLEYLIAVGSRKRHISNGESWVTAHEHLRRDCDIGTPGSAAIRRGTKRVPSGSFGEVIRVSNLTAYGCAVVYTPESLLLCCSCWASLNDTKKLCLPNNRNSPHCPASVVFNYVLGGSFQTRGKYPKIKLFCFSRHRISQHLTYIKKRSVSVPLFSDI